MSGADRAGNTEVADTVDPTVTAGNAGTPTAGPGRRVVLVVLVVLVLLLAGTAGWLGWRAKVASDADESVSRVLATARSSIGEVFSYDSAALDYDLTRARSLITGNFATEFEQTARDLIVPSSREKAFTVTAEVTRVALIEARPDRVDALLVVHQTATDSTQPQSAQDTLQLVVSMTRTADGAWLISDVIPL